MNIIANYKEDLESITIVDGLFNTKTLSMLYADEKMGKTLICLYIVGLLSSNRKLFDRYAVKKHPLKILYFSGELLSQLLEERIELFKKQFDLNFDNVDFILGKNYNIDIFEFFNLV